MTSLQNSAKATKNASQIGKHKALSRPEMTPEMAAEMIYGCYNLNHLQNKRLFVQSAVAALARFNPSVLRKLCDPVAGILGKSKFAPTIAELVQLATSFEKEKTRSKNFV